MAWTHVAIIINTIVGGLGVRLRNALILSSHWTPLLYGAHHVFRFHKLPSEAQESS